VINFNFWIKKVGLGGQPENKNIAKNFTDYGDAAERAHLGEIRRLINATSRAKIPFLPCMLQGVYIAVSISVCLRLSRNHHTDSPLPQTHT